ncbi:hypothetical protein ACH5RR_024069 [Cinchona calisaya]|uniref:Uncharacterized protein n=1 Tax=Cinchona calisaya TaxID=153742 RepID=A0ABD2ZCF0_9GENT
MAGEKNSVKSDEASKKSSAPQLVKFNRASKLAEQWVNNMSKLDADDKSVEVKVKGRLPRLGVGAAVPGESKVVLSNDPVERRLRAKLEADKRKVVKNAEKPAGPALDGSSHQDSDEEELESKAKAFVKKRPVDWNPTLLQTKKKTQVTRFL